MNFLLKLIPTLVSWYLRLVRLTSRVVFINEENLEEAKKISKHGNYAIATWHEHYPTALTYLIDSNIISMASKSKDGTIAAKTATKLGITPTRGSSSRGGRQALQSMIDLINKTHHNSAITVDGPRGPRYIPKKGIFIISHECKVPVLPIQAVSTRHITFEKSWDKTKLPKLFGKFYVAFGKPFFVENIETEGLKESSDKLIASQEALTEEIRQQLNS